jgi:hypothetical protein
VPQGAQPIGAASAAVNWPILAHVNRLDLQDIRELIPGMFQKLSSRSFIVCYEFDTGRLLDR